MTEFHGRGWHTLPKWMEPLIGGIRRRIWGWANFDSNPEDALESAERSLQRAIRIYGPDGGPTAVCRGEVAKRLEALGRWDEARTRREEALDAYRRRLGDEHRYSLDAEMFLGDNLRNAGLTELARKYYLHVCEVRRRTLGPGDSQTQLAERCLDSLGGNGDGQE
jgi:tetratricopeptide (TPR) repeat protein